MDFRQSPEEALATLARHCPWPWEEGLGQALAEGHAHPPRSYHHLGHVAALAEAWASLQAEGAWQRPLEVFACILAHDLVYRPGAKDNEAQSAAWAKAKLPAWCQGQALDWSWVGETVLLTARHGALGGEALDPDQALFLDLDMAILAAPAPLFEAYDEAIRQEHARVPGWIYRWRRRAFLRALLGPKPIFLSALGQARWEARARENLGRALGA